MTSWIGSLGSRDDYPAMTDAQWVAILERREEQHPDPTCTERHGLGGECTCPPAAGLADIWCAKCDQPAIAEYAQPDGSTVALCRGCTIDQRWKDGNRNWQQGRSNER